MIEYLNLFLNNILPIFLAASAGYLIARWLPINPRTLSSVTFYIFSPCLVFTLLTHTKLSNGDILKVILFTILCASAVGGVTWLIGRGLHLSGSLLSAILITSMFMNAGNYGLPVTSFAFGDSALAVASLIFVTNSILSNTVGVVIASSGTAGVKRALINVIKIPALYGLVLAIIFLRTGWQIPLPIERTTKLLGDASIPMLLILLGVQFHSIQLKGKIIPLSLASGMRLIVSPAIALGISILFGLSGPVRQAAVLEAAMPAAVMNTVLATQFDTEPSFVSAVVGVTTILSIFTLPPLLALLGG